MTTARIDARFAELKTEGRAAFVAYVMGGDPDLATSLKILKGLPAAGADVIELGFAFSDPIGEGPTIQAAAQRALAKGVRLDDVLGLARAFREDDQKTPLILMGYLNVVVNRGEAAFARDIAAAGIDGVIIVDCPPEESGPLADALAAAQVSLLNLFTPTRADKRLAPRLLAEIGVDRTRYADAASLQALAGTAPVAFQSGNYAKARKRYACLKPLRNALYQFAWQSTLQEEWALAYYQRKRAQGKSHSMAVRALANVWVRIIYRMWVTQSCYQAAIFEAARRAHAPRHEAA